MSAARRLGRGAAITYYRLLLWAYPRDFRRRDGAEAAAVFADACSESRRDGGIMAVSKRLVHAVVQVPRGGFQMRFSRRGDAPRRRVSRPGAPALAELATDARYALRSLRHRPGLTLAILTTLALGIGANTAIFSVIDATILASSPWPEADRLVLVRSRLLDLDTSLPATVEELQRWRREADVFERLEAREPGYAVLGHPAGALRVDRMRVTTGYLDALGHEPVLGRHLRADDARPDAEPVVVVPEAQWRRLYGADPDIVGSTVDLDGVAHVVVGVAAEVRGIDDRFYTPLPVAGPEIERTRTYGVAWLRPGITFEQATARLAAVSHDEDERLGPFVGELARDDNQFWTRDTYRSPLLGLLGAVLLVLLIACVNVANLLLAGAGARRGELAVRAAMGATRGRLARFLLAESLILSIFGGILGVGLARAGLWLIVQMRPAGQLGAALEDLRLDATVLAYAAAVTMLAAMVFGALPALRSAREGQRGALQASDPRAGGTNNRLRSVLVAAETSLAVVLLIAAGLTFRSFVELRLTDPGFDASRVLSVQMTLPETRYPNTSAQQRFLDTVVAEVARVPGVAAVSLGYGALPPSELLTGGELLIEGREAPSPEVWVSWSVVQENFLSLIGIPLLAGRDLSAADVRGVATAADLPVVVNRSMAERFWPDGNALGARFRFNIDADQRWKRIVGIAADVTQHGFAAGFRPQMYEPFTGPNNRYAELFIRLQRDTAAPIQEIRGVIGRLDPLLPTDDLDTAATRLVDAIAEPRFRAVLFGSFGALSLALAAVGIFGVVAYAVSQRSREMGIRLALGATPRDVRRLVLAQGMMPVAGGVVLGSLTALAVTRLMQDFLYAVAPGDPLTFVTTGGALLAVAGLATWLPARRTTRIDPVRTLRET